MNNKTINVKASKDFQFYRYMVLHIFESELPEIKKVVQEKIEIIENLKEKIETAKEQKKAFKDIESDLGKKIEDLRNFKEHTGNKRIIELPKKDYDLLKIGKSINISGAIFDKYKNVFEVVKTSKEAKNGN